MEFRPATTADRDDIIGLTKGIWGGYDYMPTILDRWLHEGGVYVGIIDEVIIGVSRIVRFGPGEWWLEGLHVGMQFQGNGYGKILNQLTIEEVRRIGTGIVRFSTADSNRSVPLAHQSGFRELIHLPFGYLSIDEHKSLPSLDDVLKECSALIATAESQELLPKLMESCSMHYAGLLQDGWEFRTVNKDRLDEVLKRSLILTTNESTPDRGIIVITPNEHFLHEGCLTLMAGSPASVSNLVPCLLPALAHLDRSRMEIDGGIPSFYLQAMLKKGFRRPDDFKDIIIFEMEI